jgi:hypothetical protein
MHISLGVDSAQFPIKRFLQTGADEATIPTEPWPKHHPSSHLSFDGNPDRRGGEWRIADQYSHRHPAWSDRAGFPTRFDPSDPPYVLVVKTDNKYHARFSRASLLESWNHDVPPAVLTNRKGIVRVSPNFLRRLSVPVTTLVDALQYEADNSRESLFDPTNVEDGRLRILAGIVRRQGQQTFRSKLLEAYRSRCVITRCSTPWVLEAAHIMPYRGRHTNTVSNGLLLRADIHTLFDLCLVSIDPDSRIVRISKRLSRTEYATMAGRRLLEPAKPSWRPSTATLAEHHQLFDR